MRRRDLKEPSAARLVVAVMWQPGFTPDFSELEREFGRIALRGETFDFDFTGYYAPEMGEGLKKCFVEFEGVHPRECLPKWKLKTMEIENRYDKDGRRQVNLDPMLVTKENVLIATSKNFPHRVYLGQGVYGDLTLIRKKGAFEALPWTYADYTKHVAFFERIWKSL